MKVTIQLLITALFLSALFASVAVAIEGGDARNGKVLMLSKCKVCHDSGSDGGKLTPLSKTMGQWDRFFRKNKHKDYPKGFEGFSKQELLDINQFLYNHAADSDQPMTCG